MSVATYSFEGILADFLTSILPKIVREPTREAIINLHRLISGNALSGKSNLVEGHHGQLELMMTAEDYLSQTFHVFVAPHNPRSYPPTMGITQEQALRTEIF